MHSRVAGLIGRGLALFLAVALAGGAAAAPTAESYAIDQRFGAIAFTVRHLGLFSSTGTFQRFRGQLTIDEAHPQNTRVAVQIETGSVAMSWAEAVTMLRSANYFDVARFPDARFTSTHVQAEGSGSYEVDGTLEIRGVSQPVVLHAMLLGRHAAPEPGVEIADFVVTGQLRRSQFGMTSDSSFISDRVDLRIDARIRLEAGNAG